MNRTSFLVVCFAVIVLASGCASVAEVKNYLGSITRYEEHGLDNEYLKRGRKEEKRGDWVAAYTQYELALTANPSDQEALKGRNLMEIKLKKAAEAHYNKGLKLHREGKYGYARREFLVSVRLWPDNPKAVEMLTSRKRLTIKKYIVHTIKPGENISKLAEIYYGDYKKFPLIAKYNDLNDATQVSVGQKIMIPELEGVKLLVGKKKIKTEAKEIQDPGAWTREQLPVETKVDEKPVEIEPEEKEEKKEAPVDQVAFYRDQGIELFEGGRYQEAGVEFDKVLNVNPGDGVALEYAYKCRFEQGMILYDLEDYLPARDQFKASLKYKKDCKECLAYMEKSEEFYKEMHFKKGIQYFGKELLVEAIEEWELVRAVDPKYKRVTYLIDKANTILEKVEKLKESKAKQLQE